VTAAAGATAPTFRWPGLGFDPAPGDPAGVAALAAALSGTGRRLRGARDALAALAPAGGAWEGGAAGAFAAVLQELPAHLAQAEESLGRAAGLLAGWRGSLEAFGTRARDLEERAAAARGDLLRAEAAEERARAHPDLALVGRVLPAEELPAARARVDAAAAELERAVRTASALHAGLQDLLRRAGALRDEHGDEARRVAEGVRRAADAAPPAPALVEAALGWVGEHLGVLGDVAGVVSGVAGALALVPVLTPCAGSVALVAGGAAALAHGAELVVDEDKRADPSAWVGFGADVVGLVPGGRLVLGEAFDLGLALSAAGPGYGVLGALLGGADGFGRAATALGSAGPFAEIVGARLATHLDALVGAPQSVDPSVVGKAVEAVLGTSVQGPTVHEWIGGEDRAAEKDLAAGAGSARTLGDLGLERLAAAAP
jgi:hypothetical protein